MKRIICAVFCLLLLTGCGKEPADVKCSFAGLGFTAHIFYYGKEYECAVKVDNTLKTEVLVTSPQNLKDFTLILDNGSLSSTYKGMKFTPDITALPQGSFVKELYQMILNVSSDKCEIYKSGKEFFAKGRAESKDFTLNITEAGLPLYAEFDKNDFYITFLEVAYL